MAQRLSGLGRGLSSLIPDGDGPSLQEIRTDSIEPNPNQPRVHFNEELLTDLAASVKELGVLQPILVRPLSGGRYQLIAGERRWRAATRAGLATVPAVIRTTTDLSSVEQALVENLHRADLTALEEAAAYQQLIEDFAFTHEKLAQRVGKSRAAITNTLRLLQLPASLQQLVADGRLTAGHARALLGTTDRAYQEQLARRIVAEGWSVRATEDAIRAREAMGPSDSDGGSESPADPKQPDTGRGGPRLRSPAVLEIEKNLSDALDTRVSIALSGQRGKIVIEFADFDDLGRIYDVLAKPLSDTSHAE